MFMPLFLSVSGMLMSEVCAMNNIPPHKIDLYSSDDVNQGSVDIMRNLMKEEFDKRWSNIVSDLQGQIVEQGRRIQYLEKRDKRRQAVVDRLALHVLKHGINHDKHPAVRTVGDRTENEYRDQIHVHKGIPHTDNDSQTVKIQYRIKNGDENKAIMESDELPHISRRQGINQKLVAFSAYSDNVVHSITDGQTIIMNRILLNDGNAYSTQTGVFTAPVSGVYIFHFHLAAGDDSATTIRLVLNGQEEVDAFMDPLHVSAVSASNTAVLRVVAGHSVWLKAAVNSGGTLVSYRNERMCSFSGVFLY